jgi:hypothetical protein
MLQGLKDMLCVALFARQLFGDQSRPKPLRGLVLRLLQCFIHGKNK